MTRRALISLLVAVAALITIPSAGLCYEAYRTVEGNGYCAQCHPGFISRGTLHDMHQGNQDMTNNCQLCHTSTGDTPLTYSSGETDGQGCRGCHGIDNGSMFSWGAGLRAHHINAGAPPDGNGQTCMDCHSDPPPATENIAPVYYSRSDVNVKDPCDSTTGDGEDHSGDGQGLDNDGDLVYDEADSDCSTPTEAGDSFAALPALSISPNPVSEGNATFFFAVPSRTDVRVTVHDVSGRTIHTSRYRDFGPGTLAVPFGGTNRSRERLPSGIYVVRVHSAVASATARMVWIK